VEICTDPVAGDAGRDAVTVFTGKQLDGPADVREALARATGFDALVRALFGHGDQFSAAVVHSAHAVGRGAVTVETVQVDGHVDGYDVAVDQRPVVRHSVTHDVVDRRAQGLPEPPVVQRRRVRVVVDDQIVHEAVHVVRGGAHRQPVLGAVQHELGQLTALPEHLDLAPVLDFRRTVVVGLVDHRAGLRVRRQRDVLRHRPVIADCAQFHQVVHPEIVGLEFLRPQGFGQPPRR